MLRVESIAPLPPSLKPPSPSQSLTSLRDVLAYNVRACRVVIGLSQEHQKLCREDPEHRKMILGE